MERPRLHEGGETVPRVRLADFARDASDIARIRLAVFVEEQRVPEEIEMDDRDEACVHALAFDGEVPVGTVRIDFERGGKVGRLAVLADARRRGIGTALMELVHGLARERGLGTVWCHAQRAAVPFYERLGYRVSSEPFDEAGIEHVRMERAS